MKVGWEGCREKQHVAKPRNCLIETSSLTGARVQSFSSPCFPCAWQWHPEPRTDWASARCQTGWRWVWATRSRRAVLDTRPAKDRARELTLLTPANEHPAETHGELPELNARLTGSKKVKAAPWEVCIDPGQQRQRAGKVEVPCTASIPQRAPAEAGLRPSGSPQGPVLPDISLRLGPQSPGT